MRSIQIRDAISHHNISVYTCPIESDDEETTNRNIDIMVSPVTVYPYTLIYC